MVNLKLIVIEGTDGCGKQTQSDLLEKNLQHLGLNVKRQSFPNYESKSSAPVVMYLSGELCDNASGLDAYQSSSIFAVDRLCTFAKLKQQLDSVSGDLFLICDRFVESNLIHQASKLEDNKKDEFAKWLLTFEYETLKLPKPDLIIFLNMPVDVSFNLAKGRKGYKSGEKVDIHEKDLNFMSNSYKTGLYFADKFDWNVIDCVKCGKVKEIGEIEKEIFQLVLDKFKLNDGLKNGKN